MKAAKIATAILGAVLLSGCIGVQEHRGSVIDKELVSAVQVGVDNKESVARVLGRPTFNGAFGDSDWYYVSRDTKQFAFRTPRIMQQTILHVRFDAAGNVIAVNETGPELVARINPEDDTTPTLGRRKSFFDEIFGNIGAVNSPLGNPQQPQQ
ncbi:outer membrane protein assembly factor BamE [Sphingomonas sabuli]|uniref:Outer membrane protein assembly factor BamE n=1 Tax=Sphingomonas sabuli TaxID=2764186 RepID=A0A7G9L0K3_9SPHN|nr:outer membrane protein assembly factor BamE [Sphingomonas sabuli]QNM82152.1 outer membrane protein assembly factor BamE [Sphingomonas sabuli]